MSAPQRPSRAPAAPELGRLGMALSWLAGAQGTHLARPPRRVEHLTVTDGAGLAAGRAEADSLADSGVDLITVEAPGDVVPALVLLCALLDLEPVVALGTAPGPDWAARVIAVRDGLRRARQHVGDPEQLVADPVLGELTGLLLGCAVRRTAVVLGDGVPVAAAALAAERLATGSRLWWLAGSAPTSRAAQLAHQELALEPLLELGLQVPGGAAIATRVLLDGLALQRIAEARGS